MRLRSLAMSTEVGLPGPFCGLMPSVRCHSENQASGKSTGFQASVTISVSLKYSMAPPSGFLKYQK